MGQKSYRALVVDSEPEEGSSTANALATQNFRCDLATDGDQALQLFDQQSYDAVVTCLQLPKRHGHSLVVELLSRPEPPRIVVLTRLMEPRLIRDLLARGVDDIIHKPSPGNLLATKLLALFEKENWRVGQSVAAQQPWAPVNRMQLLQSIETELAELSDCFDERLSSIFDFDDHLSEAPQAITDFIRRLNDEDQANPCEEAEVEGNVRAAKRVLLQTAVTAIPVSNQFEKSGDPFKLALRDVSASGMRMYSSRATNDSFLAISWNAETLPYRIFRVVAQVTRCRPEGRFYEIGGQFVLAEA
ncbi:MAG: response regulator [Aeoliella sp.]